MPNPSELARQEQENDIPRSDRFQTIRYAGVRISGLFVPGTKDVVALLDRDRPLGGRIVGLFLSDAAGPDMVARFATMLNIEDAAFKSTDESKPFSEMLSDYVAQVSRPS